MVQGGRCGVGREVWCRGREVWCREGSVVQREVWYREGGVV